MLKACFVKYIFKNEGDGFQFILQMPKMSKYF